MKTLLKLALALAMLASFAVSPMLVSADSPNQAPALPDCTLDPEACQNMLAQYVDTFGPLPQEEPVAPEPTEVADISMTGGEQEPTPDMVAIMRDYDSQLHEKALFACTDDLIRVDVQTFYRMSEETYETFLAEQLPAYESVGYAAIEAEYNAYLKQQADAGFNVPTRAPMLRELMEQFPGCLTGEYEPGK